MEDNESNVSGIPDAVNLALLSLGALYPASLLFRNVAVPAAMRWYLRYPPRKFTNLGATASERLKSRVKLGVLNTVKQLASQQATSVGKTAIEGHQLLSTLAELGSHSAGGSDGGNGKPPSPPNNTNNFNSGDNSMSRGNPRGKSNRRAKYESSRPNANARPGEVSMGSGVNLYQMAADSYNHFDFDAQKNIHYFMRVFTFQPIGSIDLSTGASGSDYFKTVIFPLLDNTLRRSMKFNTEMNIDALAAHLNATFGLLRYFYTLQALFNFAATVSNRSTLEALNNLRSAELKESLMQAGAVLSSLSIPPNLHKMAYDMSQVFLMRPGSHVARQFFPPALRYDTAGHMQTDVETQIHNCTDTPSQLAVSAQLEAIYQFVGTNARIQVQPPKMVTTCDTQEGRMLANLWINQPHLVEASSVKTVSPTVATPSEEIYYFSIDDRLSVMDLSLSAQYLNSTHWEPGLVTPEDGVSNDRDNSTLYYNPVLHGWAPVNDGYEARLSENVRPYSGYAYGCVPNASPFKINVTRAGAAVNKTMHWLYSGENLSKFLASC